MGDIQRIAEEISSLTLLQARDLVKALEEKLGIKAAVPMAMAAMPAPGAAGAEAAPAEEKTEFDVILTGFGDKKIQVIKIQSILGSHSPRQDSLCARIHRIGSGILPLWCAGDA